MSRDRTWLWVVAIWVLATACATVLRPVTPIDETRYLSVAWEMHLAGNPWLPALNGETYSHKPPLLFWLIDVLWHGFGVNDVSPRLLTSAFGLAVLLLTARCAAFLAGGIPAIGARAALVLVATSVWFLFNGAVMFDVMLTFFTLSAIVLLLGMRGAGEAWRWLLIGSALGLGMLAKGPVALLHVLLLAILAPIWKSSLEGVPPSSWWPWYRGVLTALVVAIAILAIWLGPALSYGGPSFMNQLLWEQTIDRMATTTHHLRPFWFYVAVLPALLFPWWLLPSAWRGALGLRASDAALLRVLASWIIPVFLAFSLFNGKQLHYLMPLLPAFAVAISVAVTRSGSSGDAALRMGVRFSLAVVIAVYLAITLRFKEAYDVEAFAQSLGRLQMDGAAIAHLGRYHGQFQFAGRLKEPLPIIQDEADWNRFKTAHPDGYVITYSPAGACTLSVAPESRVVRQQPFRSREVFLWSVGSVDWSRRELATTGAPKPTDTGVTRREC